MASKSHGRGSRGPRGKGNRRADEPGAADVAQIPTPPPARSLSRPPIPPPDGSAGTSTRDPETGDREDTGPGLSPMPSSVAEYQIVRRLDGGGMADVYVAHKMSRQGFVRRALIKRVKRTRPGYQNLQRMLLDEARATACFDHPNIVSILDVGEDDQGIYLALEYVEGTDLRWVNSKLRTRKEALPFELACYIAGEVLRGLHHAHTVVGYDGNPLEIVHRDVNPANVLISYTGHVKLADFGVVRMRDRLQHKTEAGLVKGKYAYLAPEYIAGESCNYQTDIYAAGVMLFELLCGRECFTGATAYEVMWKIVNRGVPLYRLEREGVPEDLARIVQRSVNPVPERRFESAQEMGNALETWLMRNGKHATPWVLSVFFARHSLFPARGEVPRPVEEQIEDEVEAPPLRVPAAPTPAPRAAVELPLSEPRDWVPPDDTSERPREPAHRMAIEERDKRFEGGHEVGFEFGAEDVEEEREALPPTPPERSRPRTIRDAEGSAPSTPASFKAPLPVQVRSAERSGEQSSERAATREAAARAGEKTDSTLTIGLETPSGKWVVIDDVDITSIESGDAPTRPSVPATDADLGPARSRSALAPPESESEDDRRDPAADWDEPEAPRSGVDLHFEDPIEAHAAMKAKRANAKTARTKSSPDLVPSPEAPPLDGPPIATVPPPRVAAAPVAVQPPPQPVPTQVPISRTPSRIPVPVPQRTPVVSEPSSPATLNPAPAPLPAPTPPSSKARAKTPPRVPIAPSPAEGLTMPAAIPTAPRESPAPIASAAAAAPQAEAQAPSKSPARARPPAPPLEPPPPRLPRMPTPPGIALTPAPPAPAPPAPAQPALDPAPVPATASAGADEPPDVWRGKLEDLPAAEVLARLTQATASGRLSFTCGLIWKQIQLDEGIPIGITSNMGMELIGEHLVKARLLSRRELDRALQASEREGQPLTVKLLELKLLDRGALEEELGKNLTARLSEVLEWRWGTFEFTPQPPVQTTIRPKLDLPALISKALHARRSLAPAEEADPEASKGDSAQSKLKEAFKRARSITQSSGKGRVDNVGGRSGRQTKRDEPPTKR